MKIHGTAKGGALSTKDFGVAFGGAAAATGCSTYPQSITTTAAGAVDGAVISETEQHFGDGCLSFDKDNENLVNCDGLLPAMHGTVGSMTIWLKIPSNHEAWILTFGADDAQSYVAISCEPGYVKATGTGLLGTKWQGRSTAALNTWHHVAIVQDGTAVKFYHNNSEVTLYEYSDLTFWIEAAQNNVRLGCRNIQNLGDSAFFEGFVQGVCLWNVAISDDVRDYIYNSGAGRPISELCPTYNSDNIIAWYNCQTLTNSTLVNNATPVS